MSSIPASAITSASPIFWQVMPLAPALICNCASIGFLLVLICGRLATAAASQAACTRAMLRSTLSMSMTAQGVPYSFAILAARGVVIGADSSSACSSLRAKRSNPWLSKRRDGLLRRFAPRNDEDHPVSCLLDFLAKHFEFQPPIFGRSEILLGLGDGGGHFLEFLAILGLVLGIVKQPLLLRNLFLQLGDGLRQRFQRVLFVEIEPPLGRRGGRRRRGLRLLLRRNCLHLVALEVRAALGEHVRIAAG